MCVCMSERVSEFGCACSCTVRVSDWIDVTVVRDGGEAVENRGESEKGETEREGEREK